MKTSLSSIPPLYIFFSDFTGMRGGEKFLFSLMELLDRRFRVILVVEHISGFWKSRCKKHHIRVILLAAPKRMYWGFLPIFLWRNYFFLKKIVHENDQIIAANFPISLLGTRLSKKSLVFCFEPYSIFYDVDRFQSAPIKERALLTIIRLLYRPLDKFVMKHAEKVATINAIVGDAMRHTYGREPNFFIPNGVDTNFFSPTCKPLFCYKNALVLGHSTDYSPLKGTENFLRALPLVIQKEKHIHVLISESVKNQKVRAKYRLLIKELGIQQFVHFVGIIPEKKLPRFYTSCSAFCYCGSTTCIGGSSASLSVIEAQSCGIPVLRTKGNYDEILNGQSGYYFNSESPKDIASTILRFCSLSQEKRVEMKKTSRTHCKNSRSWAQSANTLLQHI